MALLCLKCGLQGGAGWADSEKFVGSGRPPSSMDSMRRQSCDDRPQHMRQTSKHQENGIGN